MGRFWFSSISHTNEQVKIYGHYAIIEGTKLTFYRYRVKTFTLGPGEDTGSWKKTHDFVREIYSEFYPTHLKRIQDALKQMTDPRARATVSSTSIDDIRSQGVDSTAPSAGPTPTVFTKPDAPASKKRREQTTQQEDWFREQLHDLKQEQALQEKRYAEQEKRHAQEKALQEKRYAEEKTLQEKRYAEEKTQQREQMEMLKQLLNRK